MKLIKEIAAKETVEEILQVLRKPEQRKRYLEELKKKDKQLHEVMKKEFLRRGVNS